MHDFVYETFDGSFYFFIGNFETVLDKSNFCFKNRVSQDPFSECFSFIQNYGRRRLVGLHNEALFIYLSIPHYNNGEKLQYHFSVVHRTGLIENRTMRINVHNILYLLMNFLGNK